MRGAGGAPVLFNGDERLGVLPGDRRGVLDGVADGRLTADPVRSAVGARGPVAGVVAGESLADAVQPAEHERDVAAEHAAVLVDLVDDDGFEAVEEPVPQAVGVGQDA